MLTETQRRRLAEFEGRCWHEPDGPYAVGIHRKGGGTVIQKCIKCNVLMSTTEQAYQQNPTYSTWNSVMPLLAKIVERGEWEAFYGWLYDEKWKANHFDLFLFANFADPEHTAVLVDQAIMAQVLWIDRDGKKPYWFEDGWRERGRHA